MLILAKLQFTHPSIAAQSFRAEDSNARSASPRTIGCLSLNTSPVMNSGITNKEFLLILTAN
jgi:hypothetical protein